jgi:endothelin-converting enzyme/putative endopeptidase
VSLGPHAPPQYRVLGAPRNVPAFYEAFDIKEGDGMYLPEDQRVNIW